MNKKYSIILITTNNCRGCSIAKTIIDNALLKTSKHIQYDIRDFTTIPKKFLIKHKISDYPAIVFIVDDEVKFVHKGTAPLAVIVRYIDIYLK